MIETIFLAFIVAKIKGYKVSNIFRSWTIYPVIIMEIVIWYLQIMIFMGNYSVVSIAEVIKPLYLCSYIGLIIKYELFRQALIGSAFAFIGGLLNDIAIKANGGYMPVFPSLSYITGYIKPNTFSIVKDIHILGNSETNLKLFTDYIDLGYSILSIGDVLIRIFVFIILFYSINKNSNLEIKEIEKC